MLRRLLPVFFLLMATPVEAKGRPAEKKAGKRAQTGKPPVAASPESLAVLREEVDRKVSALVYSLRPSVASRFKSAAVPFQQRPLDGAPWEMAWRSAEESVRATFGPGLLPDQRDALTLLVVGLGVQVPGGATSPLLAQVAERLRDRQATLRKSLDSIR